MQQATGQQATGQQAGGLVGAAPAAPGGEYRRGVMLVAGGALAWSSSGLIARATTTDPWTTLLWRSIFAFLFLTMFVLLRDRGQAVRSFARLGLPGLGVAVCFAASMVCFINALQETSVANVMVFQAAAPFVAAVVAWIWLHERLSARSLAAILATLIGIVIMVSGSVGTGRFRGDLLSAGMGITFALTIVLVRRYRHIPMTAATCAATLLTGLAALPLASFSVSLHDLLLLAAFGVGQMGLGLIMFTAGVRLMPAADAGLVSVLETVLAPLWVWLVYDEDPGTRALLGGAVVIAAVIAHTLVERGAAVAAAR